MSLIYVLIVVFSTAHGSTAVKVGTFSEIQTCDAVGKATHRDYSCIGVEDPYAYTE